MSWSNYRTSLFGTSCFWCSLLGVVTKKLVSAGWCTSTFPSFCYSILGYQSSFRVGLCEKRRFRKCAHHYIGQGTENMVSLSMYNIGVTMICIVELSACRFLIERNFFRLVIIGQRIIYILAFNGRIFRGLAFIGRNIISTLALNGWIFIRLTFIGRGTMNVRKFSCCLIELKMVYSL